MKNIDDRSAYFETALAYFDGEKIRIFTGEVNGKIPQKSKGPGHEELPYNRFFVPENELERFAQDPNLVSKYSHRKEAVQKLLNYID